DRSYAPGWERLCRRSASGRVGTITSPSTSGSAHDLQTTLPIALALHLDLHRDAFMHFRHVADHRYLASLGLQRVQRVHGALQRRELVAADAFVAELRFAPVLARRHRSQAQRQRQEDEESLVPG